MKPLFTIHAGEYLVGEELERRYPNCEVWIPTKDTGTDLLITNGADRSRNASIQVKFSKDFLPSKNPNYHVGLLACSWWTLNAKKIAESNAEFWIMAPYDFSNRKVHFVIIRPTVLLERLRRIHGTATNKYNVYLWVTKDDRCFETRRIGRELEEKISSGQYKEVPQDRDFTEYLGNWEPIREKIAT